VLAICRGMQVLNVSQGGTLVQDLAAEGHWMCEHPVEVAGGTKLASALGVTALRHCYSVHHQGLDRLGEGIVPVAVDEHGLVEAVELAAASWIVGVQWHPEDTTSAEPAQQRLFDELVRRARDGHPD
jgi:putative glutamine amidotransferase